jgi:hypothetical protein
MWAREAVQGLEAGSPAQPGAGRDRQSDRDLTLGWVREYESAVCKVKKEIPAWCESESGFKMEIPGHIHANIPRKNEKKRVGRPTISDKQA